MVRLAFSRPTRSALPLAGGVLALLVVVAMLVALPGDRWDRLIDASGLEGLLPRGEGARPLLALVAGLVSGAVVWAMLFLLFGRGGPFYRATSTDEASPPAVRRADAHPDAPPRHPLSAADLGTPPPSPPVEQGLPADLDQPLAAFDPAAIPDVPREPMRPVASIMAKVAVPSTPAPLPRNDEPSPSIAALLERLERGARRRGRG